MMRIKKGVLKWMSFGLSYFAILVVLSLLMFCFMLQMEVRNDIREAWSQVQPILFESAEGEELKVQNNDLFLFCLKSGEIVPARQNLGMILWGRFSMILMSDQIVFLCWWIIVVRELGLMSLKGGLLRLVLTRCLPLEAF